MAKKAKDDKPDARGIAKADLQRITKEALRQKERASETVAEAGAFIKNQIERADLNGPAFNVCLRAKKMEPSRRQDFIRSLLDYLHKDGQFDQTELFDDTVHILEAIIDTIKSSKPEPKAADPTITSLVN